MKPNIQKPLKFINKCNCIVDYDLLEKAILWFAKDVIFEVKSITMYGKYPCVSIYNDKIHIHRLLKYYTEKRILKRTEYVHHLDGNKLNASIDNLQIVQGSQHQSIHNKNKTLSAEHRNKISKANRNRKDIKIKKRICMPNLAEYIKMGYSINKIAKIYGCDWSTVKRRMYENPELLEV